VQNKASDETPATTELDDSVLDSVTGGTFIAPALSGPLYTPPPKGPAGGGGDGGSKPGGHDDGSIPTGGTSGNFEPNSILFPK
jgi:hypothetical protein